MSCDLIVIETGPSGYVRAIPAAPLGLIIAVVKKRKTLGDTCLKVGCNSSKTLLHTSHLFDDAKSHLGDFGITVGEPTLDLQKVITFREESTSGNVKGVEFLLKKNKITAQGASRAGVRSRLRARKVRTECWRRVTLSSPREWRWRRCLALTSTRLTKKEYANFIDTACPSVFRFV
jgi:pyruvate/2-oxoglutarate dehydrogenase complex dihydrolipoamide dehydrogenase (E3) component